MADLRSTQHHRVPWTDRWNIHGVLHSVMDWQYCTEFKRCYLNADVSTPLFSLVL
jgi:hypothetical protein